MYNIELSPSAFRFLKKLTKSHKQIADRITAAIDNLKTNPYLGKKLLGELQNLRSLPVGDYRIIYAIIEHKILIQIIKIGHRREIYR